MAMDVKAKEREDAMMAMVTGSRPPIQHDYEVVQMPHTDLPEFRYINYKGCLLPEMLVPGLREIEDFQFDTSDILICGFPKTGTTWMEEIVYQLMHEDDDPSDPCRKILKERCPHLENVFEGIPLLKERSPPRFLKSHLPYQAMPQSFFRAKPKVICTVRNPKDNVISTYHFFQVLKYTGGYNGTLEQFCDAYIQGKIFAGPFWKHIQSFWEQRDSGHVLCVFYEDLQKDFKGEVRRIAEFLGLSLSDTRLEQIRQGCTFGAMKKNKSTNHESEQVFDHTKGHFFRKGIVGDWKNSLSEEQSTEIDKVVAKELTPLGINFCYEL